MKINDRLKKIGDLVDANSFCLDVGCDHALLDIYLIKRKDNIKAIASDIKEGPVNIAKENIKKEKLERDIEVRLGDGLDTYTDEINTIIISGMGGRNMIGILKNHQEILKKIETIILSPNNYQIDVKEYLTKQKFYIDKEEFVKEGKFIYQIIVFKRGKKHYTKKELFFGPIFLQNKNKLFKEYYERELLQRKIILKMLPNNFYLKKYQTEKEIKLIEKELI